jgi:protein TonB
VADARYYIAKELDMQPSALQRPEPAYPPMAEEQGVSGRVVVRLHLESDGSVSKAEVVLVAPGGVFGELFKKATLDSLKTARFRPAQRDGLPVRAVVEIPVVFESER